MIAHSKPFVSNEDIHAVQQLMQSAMIARGSAVSKFESTFGEYVNLKHTFATGSGTAALILALSALQIGRGDEVILPTYVCDTVMNAVRYLHATPVLCDVGEQWVMEAKLVKALVNARTKAIVLVHANGIRVKVEDFAELGCPLIEDCCQHLGENYQSVDQNHRGILSVFSFHATKCLTTGEGGAVATNNIHLAKRIEAACQQVLPQISDLQASLGLSQLARYPDMLEIRRQIANRYLQTISKHSLEDTYRIAHRTMWFRFPLLLKSQNFVDVQASFESSGISVRRGIDRLLHRSLNQSDQMFPNAIKLYEKTLSIPIYPALNRAQQDQIINATNNILSMTA